MSINEEEKCYFAGLFDGEGCVRILKSDTSSGNISYSLLVQFNLTYEPILNKMKKLFGGNIYKTNMEKKKNSVSVKKSINSGCSTGNLKQTYDYNITGWDARCFLNNIVNFCQEKKDQVIVGIEFEEKRKNRSTSEYETNRSEYYYLKLQSMKKDNKSIMINEFKDNQMRIFDEKIIKLNEEPIKIETEVITKTIITKTEKKTELKNNQTNLELFIET